MATVDIFQEAKKTDMFIGRPFYLDFDKAYLLITDAWKEKVGGIPQGTFLLAFYENENDSIDECLLLRAIRPAKLPTDNDVIASMVEYYKDNLNTSGKKNQLDDFTKYTFSFSGLECRVLGTFFKDKAGKIQFGADVENFYSAHNYVAYKPVGKVLEQIVNFRDGSSIGSSTDYRIGKIRYSSSLRFQEKQTDVPVYISPSDFLGKRTALFGMTRTGKSNTLKKIIESTTEISKKAKSTSATADLVDVTEAIIQFEDNGLPKYKVGQIIFDMNGEYANVNLQDEGTAIFEKYKDITTRYSVLDKPDFKVLKVNFFKEIAVGFELICSLLADEGGDYIKSFLAVDLQEPDTSNKSAYTRWQRKSAAYQCCLKSAGFTVPVNHKVSFMGNKDINSKIIDGKEIDPSRGIRLDEATSFWTWVAENQDDAFFTEYKRKNGHEWIDEDLKAILVF
ncbi:MAG: ATP-binding protein, partial [Clostridiaceae bacterium]|nr:ATP-binding protein [Clostridiaceae bacterium]